MSAVNLTHYQAEQENLRRLQANGEAPLTVDAGVAPLTVGHYDSHRADQEAATLHHYCNDPADADAALITHRLDCPVERKALEEEIARLRKALQTAHHELTTLHGLHAFDAACPAETWEIDAKSVLAEIDQALKP